MNTHLLVPSPSLLTLKLRGARSREQLAVLLVPSRLALCAGTRWVPPRATPARWGDVEAAAAVAVAVPPRAAAEMLTLDAPRGAAWSAWALAAKQDPRHREAGGTHDRRRAVACGGWRGGRRTWWWGGAGAAAATRAHAWTAGARRTPVDFITPEVRAKKEATAAARPPSLCAVRKVVDERSRPKSGCRPAMPPTLKPQKAKSVSSPAHEWYDVLCGLPSMIFCW